MSYHSLLRTARDAAIEEGEQPQSRPQLRRGIALAATALATGGVVACGVWSAGRPRGAGALRGAEVVGLESDRALEVVAKPALDLSAAIRTCGGYTGGCAWTSRWSCPGQRRGSAGQGSDDGSVPFLCCCTLEHWREVPGAQEAEHAPAPLAEAAPEASKAAGEVTTERSPKAVPSAEREPAEEAAPEAASADVPWAGPELAKPEANSLVLQRSPSAKPGATSPPAGAVTLFCYSVVRAGGYELPLLGELLKQSVGIFECDSYAVFSQDESLMIGTAPASLGGHDVWTKVFASAPVGVSKDGTAGNTQLFLNLWNAIDDAGLWRQADFALKVDPDAVLLPGRLRRHLSSYAGWGASFVKNCNKVPGSPDFPMMFGALEVLSRQAMEVFFERQGECVNKLPWQAWGEDYFMGKCLDMLGVPGLPDFTILGDNRCTGAVCGDGIMAAYHPFKDIASWFDCWGQATVAQEAATYTPVPQTSLKIGLRQ